MKYLQTFGFKPDNSLFKEHSWYFRNALVRANYNNFHKGVSATDEFLVKFFRNLLLGENNTLSNRAMHISNSQSLSSKSQDDTLNCTLEEMALPLSEKPYKSPVLFPFFDGLIPEGWLLDVALRNTDISELDRFSLLLLCCKDCIGAVSVIPLKEDRNE